MEQVPCINILVGDDHKVIFQGVEAMLSRNGQLGRLDYAGSIDDIKCQLTEGNYDLLILDLNLAGVNSLNYVSDFRTLSSQLKIIIFSSINRGFKIPL